jgi:phenylacetate-coenzyme A ligase PaaK-like adenylate-forming protein
MMPVYTLKRLTDIGPALVRHHELERHESWTREQIELLQRRRLDRLLRHAVDASPFYRDLYGGKRPPDGARLDDLPVVTKTMLMENFDRVVTDPRLRLADLRQHVAGLTTDTLYLGRYRVFTTSGTTGTPGIVAFDRREWRTALASALRWMSLIENRPRLPRRVRMAAVAAPSPIHVTRRISNSLDVGLYRKFDEPVTAPLVELVRSLDAFQPETLIAYPSIAAELAMEQLEGRLHIRPRIVSTGAELLTEDMRDVIREAWGVEPFNAYGITEAGGLFACECSRHIGLHAFEDVVLFEVVDERNRPVPPGATGHKLLITNLFGYTQPLIRYEVTDMVAVVDEGCPCGRPLRLLKVTEGRSEDLLHLPGHAGTEVAVHPIALHGPIMKLAGLKQYQIVHHAGGLIVRVVLAVGASPVATLAKVRRVLDESLASVGVVRPPISVEFVTSIEREGQAAKLKLVLSTVAQERPVSATWGSMSNGGTSRPKDQAVEAPPNGSAPS